MNPQKIYPILIIFSFLFSESSIAQVPNQIPVINGSWWQIADENFNAGIYSNKPGEGEPTLRDHQQVSDFTIYKAANGKWQLVSAVRATKFPGGKHFFYRWETDHITNTHWEEKGIMYTTDDFPEEAGYTQGVFYAPHCIFHDGKYYMFHNSSSTAHVMVSDDGIDFKPFQKPDGSYVIFDPGNAGRDLMVMDNREQDGMWYVYYTSISNDRPELAHRQFTDVYVRTSTSLTGDWSQPKAVGVGTPERPREIAHSQADFVNAESPFVIYRDGLWFKFEHNHVVASNDPTDFENKPIVSNLVPSFVYPDDWWPALAPEIITDGDKMYIAMFMNHHEHPLGTLKQGGVFMAEIIWVER